MESTITIPNNTYKLLQQRATDMRSTPDKVVEAIIHLQLGNTAHIEQRPTPSGAQAYLRGTRVAVRHIAALLKAGYTSEAIAQEQLPHLPASAIYEAIAYYYDHQDEVEAELDDNAPEAVYARLRDMLTPKQYSKLTGQAT